MGMQKEQEERLVSEFYKAVNGFEPPTSAANLMVPVLLDGVLDCAVYSRAENRFTELRLKVGRGGTAGLFADTVLVGECETVVIPL